MVNPLHDNPKSKPKEPEKKPDEKPAEKKPAAADGGAEKPAAEMAAAGGDMPGGDAPGGAPAAEEKPSTRDMFMDGMKGLKKRHEQERRDYHGNHRSELEKMAERHGKEIGDHFDLHFKEPTADAAPAADPAPAAEE